MTAAERLNIIRRFSAEWELGFAVNELKVSFPSQYLFLFRPTHMSYHSDSVSSFREALSDSLAVIFDLLIV